MSGTSLDGVDAAFLETDGARIIRFGPRLLNPYRGEDRRALESATQAALRWQFKGTPPNSFAQVEAVIHATHLNAVQALCAQAPEWAAKLDIIGFHGQTVLHHPATSTQKGLTLQLGDGQRLADALGVPVAYDFRQDDVQSGGQGAPLAPIYHKALVEYGELSGVTAVLNLGGVGNVTLISDGVPLMASDTGPANGPLDAWVSQHSVGEYDKGGEISLAGVPIFSKVEQWLKQGFFMRPVPRSADRYDFDMLADLKEASLEDGAASLATFSVQAVALTLSQMQNDKTGGIDTAIVCGGGRHNTAMMWMLSEHLGAKVITAEDVGWDSDAIEAQAFAFLAVRAQKNLPISFPLTTGVPRPMTGGKIATPKV